VEVAHHTLVVVVVVVVVHHIAVAQVVEAPTAAEVALQELTLMEPADTLNAGAKTLMVRETVIHHILTPKCHTKTFMEQLTMELLKKVTPIG